MRLLAAEDVVAEVDAETYAATEKTLIHIKWGWQDGLIHLWVVSSASMIAESRG